MKVKCKMEKGVTGHRTSNGVPTSSARRTFKCWVRFVLLTTLDLAASRRPRPVWNPNERNKEGKKTQCAMQGCQMILFKSARSDVKIGQNPPCIIGQIRQKSAENWDPFRTFSIPRSYFFVFFCVDFDLE
jgi:hypothetical protein